MYSLRSSSGLSGICDSLLYATTPLGMLFCGPTSMNADAAKVAKEIQAPGSSTGSILYDIATGASPGDGSGEPPPSPPGFSMPWWIWLAGGLGVFALVAVGGGSPRRYGR